MSSELKVRTIILLEEIWFPAYFDFRQGSVDWVVVRPPRMNC